MKRFLVLLTVLLPFLALGQIRPISGSGSQGPPGSSGGSGATNLGVGQTIYLDAAFGNDATAQRTNAARPFLTASNAVAAMLSGDTLVVRGGTYLINPKEDTAGQPSGHHNNAGVALTNKSNIRIVGEPGAIWAMSSQWSNACPMMTLYQCTNVLIEGMTFRGIRTNLAALQDAGIMLKHCDGVTFTGNRIQNWQSQGISDISQVTINRNIRILDNDFSDIGGTNHITLGTDGTAISVIATNLLIKGNRFYRNLRDFEICCDGDARGLIFEGNISVECYQSPIILASTNTSEARIVNNIARGYATNVTASGGQWLEFWAGSNVVVQGNQIGGYASGIVYSPKAFVRLVDIGIYDNVFHDCGTNAINIHSATAVTANVERVSIMRNKVKNVTHQAFTISANHSRIEDNEFADCNTSQVVGGVIRVGFASGFYTNSTNISIVGNKIYTSHFSANTSTGIVIYGLSHSNKVWGNEVTSYAAPVHDLGEGTLFMPLPVISNRVDQGSFLLPVRSNWVNNIFVNDRIAGKGGNQLLYFPGSASFGQSIFLGNGGTIASHSTGSEGYDNTGLGINSLYLLTTGERNTAAGTASMRNNAIGSKNVSIGDSSMFTGTANSNNVAIGVNALYNLYDPFTNYVNVAVGFNALNNLTNGLENTGVGSEALTGLYMGNFNTSLGSRSLDGNKSSLNTGIGWRSGYIHWLGSNNVFVGSLAGDGNAGGQWDGAQNTIVGASSAFNADTGFSNNITLGFMAGFNLVNGSGNIIIGNAIDPPATNSANTLTIGNLIYGTGLGATGVVVSTGMVGISQAAPMATLDVGLPIGGTTRPGFHVGTNATTGTFITTNGRVTIGTPTPTAPLTVTAGTDFQGININGSPTGDYTYLQFFNNNGTTAQGALYGRPGRISMSDSSGNDVLTVQSRNVGIGTLAPATTLDVTGKVNMSSAVVSNLVSFWPPSPSTRMHVGWMDGTTAGGIPGPGTNFGFFSHESGRFSLFRIGLPAQDDWAAAGAITSLGGRLTLGTNGSAEVAAIVRTNGHAKISGANGNLTTATNALWFQGQYWSGIITATNSNQQAGRVRLPAASGSYYYVTNTLVTANSIVLATQNSDPSVTEIYEIAAMPSDGLLALKCAGVPTATLDISWFIVAP